ncbi:MAG TPA: archaeosortase/exosortase family protein [Nitrososphaerales archaeon]|nr:archaeosortase/exosortase family protein [Nitrososphaerales archaeon]
MRLDRAKAFVICIGAAFLLPLAIPRVGLDYPYFFIMSLVLMAWFTIKGKSVQSLTKKGKWWEVLLGVGVVIADYVQNFVSHSTLGLTDMILVFSAVVVAFYGIGSFRLFWVPVAYGVVLLLGYQIDYIAPNFVTLQNWMASIMASSMQVLGINASVSGHVVTMDSSAGTLFLNVEGDCTGVQGILAFGMLSTMAVLDIKARASKIIPLFVIGFVGAFLINIVRLFGVFLSFEYLGTGIGSSVHVYLGYLLFIVWVMIFWSLAFKYLLPSSTPINGARAAPPSPPPMP